VFRLVSSVTSASHTWVVRALCTRVATQAIVPSRAVAEEITFWLNGSEVIRAFGEIGEGAVVACRICQGDDHGVQVAVDARQLYKRHKFPIIN
jgi:hypothetical protein